MPQIICYTDDTPEGRLAASLPGCIAMQDNALPTEKPLIAIIQVSCGERWNLAWQLARNKTPIALMDVKESDAERLCAIAGTARRNKAAAALLGSWRYIPAVAALKEMADTMCLGRKLSLSVQYGSQLHVSTLDRARMDDLATWLTGGTKTAPGNELPVYDLRLTLSGENGEATADFSLDGRHAQVQSSVAGYKHKRFIPTAHPLTSELAVLGLSIAGLQKIKTLPMLMPLPISVILQV